MCNFIIKVPDQSAVGSSGSKQHSSTSGSHQNSSEEPVRILCLDGGGVRGVVTATILEKILGEGKKPCEIFDIICGTSTGGILAIMIGIMKLSPAKAVEQYKKLSATIFPISWYRNAWHWINPLNYLYERYPTSTLEQEIKKSMRHEKIDEETLMCDVKATAQVGNTAADRIPRVFVVSRRNGEPYLFRNYHDVGKHIEVSEPNSSGKQLEAQEPYSSGMPVSIKQPDQQSINMWEVEEHGTDRVMMWQAARATSAAPTYFRPMKIHSHTFIDGGLGYNNPVALAVEEYLRIKGLRDRPNKKLVIISIGTGKSNPGDLEYEDTSLRKVFSMLKHEAAESESNHRLFESVKNTLEFQYFRFNPEEVGSLGLDASHEINKMIEITKDYLNEPDTDKKIIEALRSLENPKTKHHLNSAE